MYAQFVALPTTCDVQGGEAPDKVWKTSLLLSQGKAQLLHNQRLHTLQLWIVIAALPKPLTTTDLTPSGHLDLGL
jgi:hypothetical protein